MPFGAGTFSLTINFTTEAGVPPIEIAKLDTQFVDIAAGLSNCILRDGTGLPTAAISFNGQKITGLGNATADAEALNRITADGRYFQKTAILLAPDGAVGAPAYSFTSDPDTGIYRNSANNLRVATGGVVRVQFTDTFMESFYPLYGPDGSAAAPGFTFGSDPDTGMFRNGANGLAWATAGATVMTLDQTNGMQLGVFLFGASGAAGTPSYSFAGDPDTGMFRNGANRLSLAAAGAEILTVLTDQVTLFQQLRAIDGVVGGPAISFSLDTDTGLSRSAANEMVLVTGGANAILIDSGQHARFIDGTVAAPAITFQFDTDTGLYRIGNNTIGFAGLGTLGFAVDNTGALAIDGTVASPGLKFASDTDSGFYRIGANNFGATAGNALVMDWIAAASGGARVADYGGTLQTVGYRNVPRSTTATNLVQNDNAKCVAVSAAINIPISVFSAGDCVSIYNDSAASINITISAGTLRLAGTTTTGTRALGPRGIATLWFNVGGATPEVIASGPGLT